MPEIVLDEDKTCSSNVYQAASVCVPVTVTPFAVTGKTVTKCCGAPVVTAGDSTCEGTENGSCVFTITQDICIMVPVSFGAATEAGDPYVSCGDASDKNICAGCGSEGAAAAAGLASAERKKTCGAVK